MLPFLVLSLFCVGILLWGIYSCNQLYIVLLASSTYNFVVEDYYSKQDTTRWGEKLKGGGGLAPSERSCST